MEQIHKETKLEEEKINILEKAKEDLEKSRQEAKTELTNIKPINEKSKFKNLLYIFPIILTLITLATFILVNKTVALVGLSITIITLITIIIKNQKENKAYQKEQEEHRKEKRNAETKIELIENEIKTKQNLINKTKDMLNQKKQTQKLQIKLAYPNTKLNLDEDEIEEKANTYEEQNYINSLKLTISQKELFKKEIEKKLEEKTKIEEKLQANQELLEELITHDEEINIAKEALASAYQEMKESITPKFTENLSNSIKSITNGKYKTVKVNEENGLTLETETGNYIPATVLSQGTIDQLYLSLRISSINELTEENMPLILDETFAYFDQTRLQNILTYLTNNYSKKQIIILTCTKREEEALETSNIKYTKTELT